MEVKRYMSTSALDSTQFFFNLCARTSVPDPHEAPASLALISLLPWQDLSRGPLHIHIDSAEFSRTRSRTAQCLLFIRLVGPCTAPERITDKDWKWRLSDGLKSYSPSWQGGTFSFICLQRESVLPECIMQACSREGGVREEMARSEESRNDKVNEEKRKKERRHMGDLSARPGGSMLIRVMTEMTAHLSYLGDRDQPLPHTCLYHTPGTAWQTDRENENKAERCTYPCDSCSNTQNITVSNTGALMSNLTLIKSAF